jgi:hypothetical protein
MPETCRVLYQNKTGMISASVWLFKKKSITLHGNMNIKHIRYPETRLDIAGFEVTHYAITGERFPPFSIIWLKAQ